MSIEKLVIDHAYWSDEVRRLKKAGEKASEICAKYRPSGSVILANRGPYSCIEAAWAEYNGQEPREFGDWMHYDDVFEHSEPCEHCISVRKLKAKRMQARRRLGSVRGAITRVGRSLSDKSGDAA